MSRLTMEEIIYHHALEAEKELLSVKRVALPNRVLTKLEAMQDHLAEICIALENRDG